jgi:hypothetical protein
VTVPCRGQGLTPLVWSVPRWPERTPPGGEVLSAADGSDPGPQSVAAAGAWAMPPRMRGSRDLRVAGVWGVPEHGRSGHQLRLRLNRDEQTWKACWSPSLHCQRSYPESARLPRSVEQVVEWQATESQRNQRLSAIGRTVCAGQAVSALEQASRKASPVLERRMLIVSLRVTVMGIARRHAWTGARRIIPAQREPSIR